MAERTHILDFDPTALAAWAEQQHLPAYRTKQVLEWVYKKHAADFEAMTNLPALLRRTLAEQFDLFTSTVVRRVESNDGTLKLLLRWPDGATSECVMIPDGDRRTACIGSQVGCPVGCVFCASGLEGLERNLTTGQIVEQLLWVSAELRNQDSQSQSRDREGAGGAPLEDAFTMARSPLPHGRGSDKAGNSGVERGQRLSNVVFMGSGEPLANYVPVLAAVRAINAEWGMGIAARKITVSTVGLPSQIRRLAGEELQINLALSLHAPNEMLRGELIPWAAKMQLAELIDACRFYFDRTGREITLEYILLDGVNDRPSHAEELARITRTLRCNVNLIRYNPVSPLPFGRPSSEATQMFQGILRKHGVNAHVRRSRGMDIDAACGQLRRREKSERPVQVSVPPIETRAVKTT